MKRDPFERAPEEGIDYERWMLDRMFLFVPAQVTVPKFLATFKEFPQRQTPASFSVDGTSLGPILRGEQ